MALTAVMTTLAACSQDDELMDAAPKQAQIEFEITDGGYGGDEATRAKEEGFRTKFEAGDECGLYIIDNGEFIASNVKLTAEEGENGEITWKAVDGAISGVTENSKYFLYYPYNELDYVDAQLGDDDKTVFQNVIEKIGFDWYQDTHAIYTAKDLMTATGMASTGADGKLKVSFSLTHQMALAVIELPKTVYKFTNEDVTIPDYTVALSVDFSGSNYRPLRMEDGTYRFVFNPKWVEHGITGTVNGNKKFTISADKLKGIDKGTYKTFRIGGANATIEQKHTLQVGDYLLKDGNLVGKENLSESQKADVAAVVFAVGHDTDKDKSDYTKTGIGSAQCHGYAVALHDAITNACIWGINGTKIGCYRENTNSKDDWSGYDYTWNKIIPKAGGADKLKATEESYPATYYAVEYGKTTQAPARSSGWFLPSIGQVMEVCRQNEKLFNETELLSGYYWSSSEDSDVSTDRVEIINSSNVFLYVIEKNDTNNVRAVLAF